MNKANKDHKSMLQVAVALNMIPNIVWSLINLLPVPVFCYTYINLKLMWVFIAVSLLPILLANTFLNRIHLSKKSKTYKKLGVGFVIKFTQNGTVINSLIKKFTRRIG